MCTSKELGQNFIPSLLICYSSQNKLFKFVHQHSGSCQSTALQGLTVLALQSSGFQQCNIPAAHKGEQGYLREEWVPDTLLEKHAEFYRLKELVMHRLHIVNSFTVMEIPNSVWPWELTRSTFKGLSSEFPALAFSYHLSQLCSVHLWRAAA